MSKVVCWLLSFSAAFSHVNYCADGFNVNSNYAGICLMVSNHFHCRSVRGSTPRAFYRRQLSRQSLVPISKFETEIGFISSPESYRLCIGKRGQLRPYMFEASPYKNETEAPYILSIAEEDDLPDISRLTVDAFGAAIITLSGDLNNFERALLSPSVGLWNAYTDIVAYAEVLSGLRARMGHRLKEPDVSPPQVVDASKKESLQIAANSSLILALARSKPGSDKGIDCIASVELRLQPTDAKIPFSQPWLDRVERKIAKFFGVDTPPRDTFLQPYLSNLCVSEEARGRQIGRALVRCVETIATNTWGYSKLYLHVDLENTAAINLYKSEGFQDVSARWNPFWAGKAAEIGYFVKTYSTK